MNSYGETCALQYRFNHGKTRGNSPPAILPRSLSEDSDDSSSSSDPRIFPGLYCPSGLDMMTVLLRIYGRPNPQVHLGPIDCSVALLVCDLAAPDQPIVYASDAFLHMTGYRMHEIMGRNCRFMQSPGGDVTARASRKLVDKAAVRGMREAVRSNKEHQTTITNFRKNGKPFVNVVTLIPIRWDGQDYRFCVGFQCDKASF